MRVFVQYKQGLRFSSFKKDGTNLYRGSVFTNKFNTFDNIRKKLFPLLGETNGFIIFNYEDLE